MPGMLAFFENAVLNDRAPVIGIKDHERIGNLAIGQIDGASASRRAIVLASDNDGVDRLTLVVVTMGLLCLLWLPIAIIEGVHLQLPYSYFCKRFLTS
jgi:hypothetical protein